MNKIILSINAGSSSVKISAFKIETEENIPRQLVKAQLTGLTSPPARFSYSTSSGSQKVKDKTVEDKIDSQDHALKYILDHLVKDAHLTEISKIEDVSYACHRVVHGGDYEKAQLITEDTYRHLEKLTDL